MQVDNHPSWDTEEPDEGEDLWIVSYADMVTLLFGFFVILYSFSTIDDKKFDQMGSKMAEAFKSTEKSAAGSRTASAVEGDARQLRALRLVVSMMNIGEDLDQAVDKIERGHITKQELANAKEIIEEKFAGSELNSKGTAETQRRTSAAILELALPVSVLFKAGTDQILSKSLAALKDLAVTLAEIDEIEEVEVSGHTDSRPPGKGSLFTSNWSLSAARAGAVAQVLIASGFNPEKVRASGMAHLKPLFPEFTQQGKPLLDNMDKNRRVQIVVRKRVPANAR